MNYETTRKTIAEKISSNMKTDDNVVFEMDPYDNVGPYGGEQVVIRGLYREGDAPYRGFLVAVYSDEKVEDETITEMRRRVAEAERVDEITDLIEAVTPKKTEES